MKIAIDCCDLDHSKIDGTRVYIKNLLDRLGALAPNDQFLLYHQKDFSSLLAPKMYTNYVDKKIPYPFAWTQTRLAFELKRDKPDALWMPIQQIPLIMPKKIKSVVTIHDLAWKYFPASYKLLNKRKLDFFAQTSIKKADKIIAISQSTKKDILKFYPKTLARKISVVPHGIDSELFSKKFSLDNVAAVLEKYQIVEKVHESRMMNREEIQNSYLLYVGGLDDKENLGVLIDAFGKIKENKEIAGLKLVLIGSSNENSIQTIKKIQGSLFKKDICVTGRINFDELVIFYQNAEILVLPSKYEGFGMTILEGFAAGIPVVATNKSSLPEVGGSAVDYFDGENSQQLAEILQKVLKNSTIREEMIQKGSKQAEKFSWEKCTKETLNVIKSTD